MSLAKIIELSAESDTSFEDAIRYGIKRASETVDNITSAWVDGQQVVVRDNQITRYRVDLKVTFVLKDGIVVEER
jgi:flavin-binding protein dodecin